MLLARYEMRLIFKGDQWRVQGFIIPVGQAVGHRFRKKAGGVKRFALPIGWLRLQRSTENCS